MWFEVGIDTIFLWYDIPIQYKCFLNNINFIRSVSIFLDLQKVAIVTHEAKKDGRLPLRLGKKISDPSSNLDEVVNVYGL